MCLETEFTVFALGRCMLTVESGARKLFAEIQQLKQNQHRLVNSSDRFLDRIDNLRESYTKLLANVLELVQDGRCSIEHRDTAKRIEAIFDRCRSELWQKNCDKLDETKDGEFKDVPVFPGSASEWAQFRRVFLSRVLSNSHLNKYEKMAIFRKKVNQTIRSELPAAEPLEVQWQMLCNKYDSQAAKYHVGELFKIQGAQGKNIAYEIDSAFNEYHRHVDLLYTLGYKCDPLSEMLIGRLIQWKNCNIIDVQYSKNKLTWSKVKAQLLNIDQCYLCKGKHVLRQCTDFKQLSFEKRIEELQRRKVCMICFRWGHTHNSCGSNRVCIMCHGKHNTLIHPDDNDAKKLKELKKILA